MRYWLTCNAEAGKVAYDLDVRFQRGIAQIKEWLDDCISRHTCSWLDAVLPSRLVNVGSADALALPRIVNVKELPDTRPTYLTLSHCWGDPKLLPKLNAETERVFTDAVPMELLSKIFRDAVMVTRALEFRYLWIGELEQKHYADVNLIVCDRFSMHHARQCL